MLAIATKSKLPSGNRCHIGDEQLGDLLSQQSNPSNALQILALAYSLPDLAEKIPAESWWQLATRLHDLASEAQLHRIDWPADPQDVLRQQLLAGELPLALGYLFPEVKQLRELRKSAHATFSEALAELTDGEGLPHARLLPVLGPLFACWTRARWLGKRFARGPWSRAADIQYQWLVRHAIRLVDAQGRFVLTPCQSNSVIRDKSLFTLALDLAGDERDCAAAAATLSRHVVPKQIAFQSRSIAQAVARFGLVRHQRAVYRLVAIGRAACCGLRGRTGSTRVGRRWRAVVRRSLAF